MGRCANGLIGRPHAVASVFSEGGASEVMRRLRQQGGVYVVSGSFEGTELAGGFGRAGRSGRAARREPVEGRRDCGADSGAARRGGRVRAGKGR
ncbi:hypothetical protein EMIT0111MI5_10262 [Burkholderia sp. IT-111MI5]